MLSSISMPQNNCWNSMRDRTPRAVTQRQGIHRMKNWHQLFACGLLSTGLALAGSADAQSYPTRPVRVIVPFGTGGNTDAAARIIGAKLSERWGCLLYTSDAADERSS